MPLAGARDPERQQRCHDHRGHASRQQPVGAAGDQGDHDPGGGESHEGSLRELSLPREYGIQVVAPYDVLTDELDVVPDPDQPLKASEIAIVAGSDERIAGVVEEVG